MKQPIASQFPLTNDVNLRIKQFQWA